MNRQLLIYLAGVMLAMVVVCRTVDGFSLVESEHGDNGWREEDGFDVSKRRLASPACRACMQRRDYVSCTVCYSRSSSVPYVGLHKRGGQAETSEYDWSRLPARPADDSGEETGLRYGPVDKRAAFIACYCCTALMDRECCWRCGYPAYYGKRSSWRQSPGFISEGGCECCLLESFDYDCCMSCKKRRK
jgi:uncharacterized paraquat-inducible protein A